MAMAIVRIRHPYITLAIILVLSACVFLPTIQFEFTNWDDDIHVTNNPHVQDFSLRSAVYHFTSTTNYMYHPITMISYMVDWNLSGGETVVIPFNECHHPPSKYRSSFFPFADVTE